MDDQATGKVAARAGHSALCSAQVHDEGRWPSFHGCRSKAVVQSGGKGWCKVHDPERAKAKRAAYEAEQSARSADQSVIQIEAAALAERLGGGSVYYYQASTFKNSGHRRALVVPFDLVERLLKELGR